MLFKKFLHSMLAGVPSSRWEYKKAWGRFWGFFNEYDALPHTRIPDEGNNCLHYAQISLKSRLHRCDLALCMSFSTCFSRTGSIGKGSKVFPTLSSFNRLCWTSTWPDNIVCDSTNIYLLLIADIMWLSVPGENWMRTLRWDYARCNSEPTKRNW